MEHTHVFMRLWEQRCIKQEGFFPTLVYPTLPYPKYRGRFSETELLPKISTLRLKGKQFCGDKGKFVAVSNTLRQI